MINTYGDLQELVGRKLFGIREDFSTDQLADIVDCIRDGLRSVYSAHPWSFFRPLETITTTTPYTTGTVTIVDGVVTLAGGTWPAWAAQGVLTVDTETYEVATRDGNSQLTLSDTSATAAALSTYSLDRYRYDLPAGFDGIEGELTYEPGASDYYPPVKIVHESEIRRRRQDEEYSDRPTLAAIVTGEFTEAAGSTRYLVFYPTPDAEYILTGRMRLLPTMPEDDADYPVGSDVLAGAIQEACLAAGERFLEEAEGVHSKRAMELLAVAVAADKDLSTPEYLGSDGSTEEIRFISRMGPITLNGTEL